MTLNVESNQSEMLGQASESARRRLASSLVVVLVVLGIVGIITAQSIQTLVVLRRSHSQRAGLRQAREVLMFVRKCVESDLAAGNIKQGGERKFMIEVRGQLFAQAQVTMPTPRDDEVSQLNRCRIVVRYPVRVGARDPSAGSVDADSKTKAVETIDDSGAWTVTWQSDDWEQTGP